MHKFFAALFFLCLPVACITISGCGGSGETGKLEPAEDVDWDAIEKEEAAMAAEMTAPESNEY